MIGVAEPTPEVAPARADENSRHSGEFSLSLQRIEHFIDWNSVGAVLWLLRWDGFTIGVDWHAIGVVPHRVRSSLELRRRRRSPSPAVRRQGVVRGRYS